MGIDEGDKHQNPPLVHIEVPVFFFVQICENVLCTYKNPFLLLWGLFFLLVCFAFFLLGLIFFDWIFSKGIANSSAYIRKNVVFFVEDVMARNVLVNLNAIEHYRDK